MSSSHLQTPSTFLSELVTSSRRKTSRRKLFVSHYMGCAVFESKYLCEAVRLRIAQELLYLPTATVGKVLVRFDSDYSFTVVDPLRSPSLVSDTDTSLHFDISHIDHFDVMPSCSNCLYMTVQLNPRENAAPFSTNKLALHLFVLNTCIDAQSLKATLESLKRELILDNFNAEVKDFNRNLADSTNFEVLYVGNVTLINSGTMFTAPEMDHVIEAFHKQSQAILINEIETGQASPAQFDVSVFDSSFVNETEQSCELLFQNQNRVLILMVSERDIRMLQLDGRSIILSTSVHNFKKSILSTANPHHLCIVLLDGFERSICHLIKCPNKELALTIHNCLSIVGESATEKYSHLDKMSIMLNHTCRKCPTFNYAQLCKDLHDLNCEDVHRLVLQRIGQLECEEQETILFKYKELDNNRHSRVLDDIPEEICCDLMNEHAHGLHEKNVLLLSEIRCLCESAQAQHIANLLCAKSFPNSEKSIMEPEINLTGRARPRTGSLDISLGKLMELKDKATKSISDSLDGLGRRLSDESDALLNSIMAFNNANQAKLMDSSSSSCSTSPVSWRRKLNFDCTPSNDPDLRPRSHTVSESQFENYKSSKPRNAMLLRLANEGRNKMNTSLLRHQFMSVDEGSSEEGELSQQDRLKHHRHSHCSKMQKGRQGRRPSWRQAIFSRVSSPRMMNSREELANLYNNTDRRRSSAFSMVLSPLADRFFERDCKYKYKSLWKKAIMDQILKNRMQSQLKIKEEERTALDKQKLDYVEITPCPDEHVRPMWVDLLNAQSMNSSRLDRLKLEELVKAGIPRDLRCQVWKLMMKQNGMDKTKTAYMDEPPKVNYKTLLQQLTTHQHAILIDLGRTFPTHPYFTTPLGQGQLSLFNVLKAYSLVDPEVGYCQGLSFVAGALLLHMEEEEAFYVLLDLMYKIGLRKQYRPDMKALQVQMYQLSRLLHDRQKPLHAHLEDHEIPMLYAAPWFLTLFASTFPLGFVARVFDFIFLHSTIDVVFGVGLVLLGEHNELIRQCNSFEAINDFLKLTLPAMSLIQMERVFNAVQDLELERDLLAYEVEYHVLQEEMLSAYPSSGKTLRHTSNISEKSEVSDKIEADGDSIVSTSTTNSEDRSDYDLTVSHNYQLKMKNQTLENRVIELETKLDISETKYKSLQDAHHNTQNQLKVCQDKMIVLEKRISGLGGLKMDISNPKSPIQNGISHVKINNISLNDSGVFNTPQQYCDKK